LSSFLTCAYNKDVKRYLVEFIGTFFLVLIIAMTGNPLAIGIGLTALVYMGGYISGANYNPAVTLALWINKKHTTQTALIYMASQLLGAFMAAAVYFIISRTFFVPQPGANISLTSAVFVEILFTFLLASVVLHVAVSDKTKGNDYFGLAIGATVMAAAFAGGTISGGAYNPAVGIGPLLFDVSNIASYSTNILLYLIAPFTGAALAGLLYKKM
jgi:aquaporin Z